MRLFGVTVRRPAVRLWFFRNESSSTMEKRQLIEAIRGINPSASLKFLNGFDESALRQYLDHLSEARTRQPRQSPAADRSADRMVA